MNTGIKVAPENWDQLSRSILKGEPNASIYNIKLRKEISKLEADFATKSMMVLQLPRARLKKIAEGKNSGRDFYKFCLDWNNQKYNNDETLRTYKSEISKLKLYKKELSFGDIDLKFLTGYKRHMEDKVKNSPNTVWKSFEFINTMIRDVIIKTQKASVTLNLKLYNRLKVVVNLLKRYPLGAMSNQDFNKWLKIVANLAGIGHMNITCHVGRHTFGGLLAEMEIPKEPGSSAIKDLIGYFGGLSNG